MSLQTRHAAATGELRQRVDDLTQRLLKKRDGQGIWRGRLSSSALATATAISALSMAGDPGDRIRIQHGIRWLEQHTNGDGGWGDTTDSPSNLSTTLLCVAAMKLAGATDLPIPAMAYVRQRAGEGPAQWQAALESIYGKDRTFAVPILTNLALAALVPWDGIPDLPWALAVMPQASYRMLRLHVVSYALPALIAIGLRLHVQKRSPEGWRNLLSGMLRGRALARLAAIQPEHGGFLDAIPLTSFVAMSATGLPGIPEQVVQRCLAFLRSRQRSDGSWPIDTDLAVWLTTMSVRALHEAGALHRVAVECREFLRAAQHMKIHPYTNARPGGWAWTDLPGGVPDADDTSGAILAMHALGDLEPTGPAVRWLLSLQNADGGFPTFCRGWGKLPFDRSATDITGHAIQALRRAGGSRTRPAIARAMEYLRRTQAEDGSWTPLWFGSQHTPDHANRVLGTARALRAFPAETDESARRAVGFLLSQQNSDGGWGALREIDSTLEETAQVVAALAVWQHNRDIASAVHRGAALLVRGINEGRLDHPTPIGLYFASLWYAEELYPLVWTLEALARTMHYTGAH